MLYILTNHMERDHCVKTLMYKLYNLVAVCLKTCFGVLIHSQASSKFN